MTHQYLEPNQICNNDQQRQMQNSRYKQHIKNKKKQVTILMGKHMTLSEQNHLPGGLA